MDSHDDVVVHPVTPDRWSDLVELFERPGPRGGTPIPGTCWCGGWRDGEPTAALRKQNLLDAVTSGSIPGLIAYEQSRPVGWIAVAPRRESTRLARSRMVKGLDDGDGSVFAISCFYVDREARGAGVATALLDAAIEFARSRGATVVEAYPKASLAAHAESSARAEEAFSFMGRPSSFERRGFEVAREAGARVVVRKEVAPRRRRPAG